MKILLTGRSGQVGQQLASALRPVAQVIAPPRAELDLSDLQQIQEYIRREQPQLIVNTAAYTAVDLAEQEPDLAMHINAQAPAILAQEAQRIGAAILHYSTDYVFDGRQAGSYAENAATNPLNVYGRSKQLGEQQLSSACTAHWIVRCSWIYDVRGKNFLRTFWRLAQERKQMQIVYDQIGAPTWAHTIATATTHMILMAQQSPGGLHDFMTKHAGIYHMTANGQTSWYEMALHILGRMHENRLALHLQPEHIIAVPSVAYPTAAQRPLNSRMDSAKLAQIFQLQLPDWRGDLDTCINQLISAAAQMRPSQV